MRVDIEVDKEQIQDMSKMIERITQQVYRQRKLNLLRTMGQLGRFRWRFGVDG